MASTPFLLRWGIHNCLDEVYVPFFGAFGTAWGDAIERQSPRVLWPEMDAAFVRAGGNGGGPPAVGAAAAGHHCCWLRDQRRGNETPNLTMCRSSPVRPAWEDGMVARRSVSLLGMLWPGGAVFVASGRQWRRAATAPWQPVIVVAAWYRHRLDCRYCRWLRQGTTLTDR
jgi:hypothetical protein